MKNPKRPRERQTRYVPAKTADKLARHYQVNPEEILTRVRATTASYPGAAVKPTKFYDPIWEEPDPSPTPDTADDPRSIAIAEYFADQAAPVLDQWAQGLDQRNRTIFQIRKNSHEPPTTKILAPTLCKSHIRTRQLDVQLSRQLAQLPHQPGYLDIRLYLTFLTNTIGAAAKEEQVIRNMGLHRAHPVAEALLQMAGPYRRQGNWLVNANSAKHDPTPGILKSVSKGERISLEEATQALNAWGLHPARHRKWLLDQPGVADIEGRLVKAPKTHSDHVVLKLNQLGRPATLKEITGRAGHASRSQASAAQADPRIIHISQTRLALARWNLPAHGGGYADNIAAIIEVQGPTNIEEIKKILVQSRGYRTSAVHAIANSPRFITVDGLVRLRTPDDPPLLLPPPQGPITQRGTFKPGPRTVTLTNPITNENLRGTSIGLGRLPTAILEIPGNSTMVLTANTGQHIDLRYPVNSAAGAHTSSIRRILQEKQANPGELLALTIDALNHTLHCDVIPPDQLHRDWHTIGRLTGTSESTGPEALAQALQCTPEQIRQILQKRGDRTIYDHLPD